MSTSLISAVLLTTSFEKASRRRNRCGEPPRSDNFNRRRKPSLGKRGTERLHSRWSSQSCLLGKNFILRGGQEHHDLKLSQLQRLTNPGRYVYTENTSKNRGGGLGQLSLEHKRVPVYTSVTGESKCHVRLLDKYISKLPSSAKQRDCFYLQPLSQASEGKPWFSVQPCGKNYLAKMVPTMFAEAGVEEKKTNHSLRAAGVSQAGVDEKVIQSSSGHRRLESLHMYERVNAN